MAGGNRLASNSLLEGLVYGAHAGEGAARAAAEMPDRYEALKTEAPNLVGPSEPLDIGDVRNALKSLMGRRCGVQRSAESLRSAVESIVRLVRSTRSGAWNPCRTPWCR